MYESREPHGGGGVGNAKERMPIRRKPLAEERRQGPKERLEVPDEAMTQTWPLQRRAGHLAAGARARDARRTEEVVQPSGWTRDR